MVAIEDVYRRRYAAFCAALTCITRSQEAAAEAVQEGFARALAHRQQFRAEGPIEAWIWRIVLRTALEQQGLPVSLPLDEAFDTATVDPIRDPALAAAIRRLPPRRRLFVVLRYVADLSYREIADICAVSEGTVSATLTQARDALAEDLGYASGRPVALARNEKT